MDRKVQILIVTKMSRALWSVNYPLSICSKVNADGSLRALNVVGVNCYATRYFVSTSQFVKVFKL